VLKEGRASRFFTWQRVERLAGHC